MIIAQSLSLFWYNTYVRIELFLEYLCDFCNTVSLNERGPKMFPPFSHLLEEKIASFLTHLKSWWNLVLVFGKEHANSSNITGVMIGWSWKIKFGKIQFFYLNVNLKCWKRPFHRDWDKNGWSHLFPSEK